MRGTRVRRMGILLLLALATGFTSAASAAPPRHASVPDAGRAAALAKARTREASVLNRRLAVLQSHAERANAASAQGIAGMTRLVDAARRHIARMQERECRTETACERRAARVAEIEAHIQVAEEHIKHKRLALKARLARIEQDRRATEERLAQL